MPSNQAAAGNARAPGDQTALEAQGGIMLVWMWE